MSVPSQIIPSHAVPMSTRRLPHWCVVVCVAAVLSALTSLIQNAYYLHLVFTIAVYYLCALGMNVLVGYAGQKSLGQSGLFAVGAYTVAILTTKTSLDPWFSFLASGAAAGVFGVLVALPSLRVKGPYLAMVTLAFGTVVEQVAMEWVDVFGGAGGIFEIKPLTWRGEAFTDVQWAIFGICLCAFVHYLLRNLLNGRFGRAFMSLQIDEIASSSVGVGVYRFKVLSFVVAAVTCGLGGALVAQQTMYFNTDFIGFNLSVFILLLVLFGGAGSIYGPLLGSVILVVADSLLSRWPAVQHLVYGVLLLVALYLMPNGVAGLLKGFGARRRRSASTSASEPETPPFVEPSPDRAHSTSSAPLLTVDAVCKSYGGVKPAQNVSMEIEGGTLHALIGPNGAGKSTMINMITGIVRPDSGAVSFSGHPIEAQSTARICKFGIARTFQNLRLFSSISVCENLLVGCHSRMRNGFLSSLLALPSARREERRAREDVERILQLLDLSSVGYLPAGSLPYGLQRRVELGRALATRPLLLLLDEPAAGLNPTETTELGRLLLKIRDCGISILMVEHHMEMVMSISDRITVLDYGVKIAEGLPREIQTDPVVISAYLGTPTDEEIDAHAREAANA